MSFLGGLGSVFGALGSLLPGYMQGREAAITSNWNDLKNYGQVQHQQMQNAFDADVFDDRVSMAHDAAVNSNTIAQNNLLNFNRNAAWAPYELAKGEFYSRLAPQILPQQYGLSQAAASMALNGGALAANMFPQFNPGGFNPMQGGNMNIPSMNGGGY